MTETYSKKLRQEIIYFKDPVHEITLECKSMKHSYLKTTDGVQKIKTLWSQLMMNLSADEMYGDSDWFWWSQQLTEKSEKHVTVETPLINSMSYILYNKKVTELCIILGFMNIWM